MSGPLTIRLQHLNPVVGDLAGNARAILDAWEAAARDGVDLLVLPELVMTGYPPMDLLDRPDFCGEAFEANRRVAERVKGRTALLFGSITPNREATGRRLRNSAILARDGRVEQVVHKALLPTYDVFDEARYFEPSTAFECIRVGGHPLGVLICEDLFHNVNEPPAPLYPVEPAAELIASGARALLVLSASPFTLDKHETRLALLRRYAGEYGVPLLYCNLVGANTELIFDGDTLAVSAGAEGEGEEGKEGVLSAEPFVPSHVDVPLFGPAQVVRAGSTGYPTEAMERVFKALRLGIRDYFGKTGASDRAVLGLSGGIDSAVVCVLAAAALGPDRVTAIGLPSRYSSGGSLSDSRDLCRNLGVEWVELPIEPVFDASLHALSPWFGDGPAGLAEENLQSRIRGMLLMAWSNRFGHLLLATSNKSEMSVGYSTLYGDMCGALAPIADLYKTEVYDLARWLNACGPFPAAIPEAILTKPPSAELRPDQVDTDSLPPYEVLDPILFAYLERQASTGEIAAMGHPSALVERIVRMVDLAEYKRYQAPPVLKLHHRSFGSGRRRPLAAKIAHARDVENTPIGSVTE